MLHALVTGSSRGIGLEFARQILARGDRVVATCRRPADAGQLQRVLGEAGGRGVAAALDVGDPASAGEAVDAVREHLAGRLDLLVNNAAMRHAPGHDERASAGPLAHLEADAVAEVLRVNVVGPAMVARAFAPALAAAGRSTVVNLSSGLGSIAGTRGPGDIAYAVSKAALNMLTRKLALELAGQGTVVVAVSPGWVRTDMGGRDAPLPVEQSVGDMLAVVDGLEPESSGRFLDHSGRELFW